MKKLFRMNISFYYDTEFETEAETREEAIAQALEWGKDFPVDTKDLLYDVTDCEEEEETFEPGRPVLDTMALNP